MHDGADSHTEAVKDDCIICLRAERDALKAQTEQDRKILERIKGDRDRLRAQLKVAREAIKAHCGNNGHSTQFKVENGYQQTLPCFCKSALSQLEGK